MDRTLVYTLAFPLLALAQGSPPARARFSEHTIATDLRGGYQVVVADLNHDGKPDLIALASGMPELVWYENPGWERHVIAAGQSRMINCAVVGAGADGIPDLVLASEFSNEAKNSAGVVSVLRHNGDPRQPWTVTEIDRLPTSHRLRTADIDGSGKKVVVNAALTGAKAEGPDYRDHTPLVFYRPGEWKRQTISDENTGVVHGVYIIDWDGDGRDAILTASFTGIHLFKLGRNGAWSRTEIARGDPAPWPKSGSSDIAVGKLGKQRFLAAIEPWHGSQVAIYRERSGTWERRVIDSSLVDGHTIASVDLNGDGADEVVAGYRGQGRSVYVYYADDAAGERWSKQVLDDGGMGAAACAVGDLNGDRRPDIACIGSATMNLKWYENLGSKAEPAPRARMGQEMTIDHVTVAGKDFKSMQANLAAVDIQSEYGGPHSNHATEMALTSSPDGSYLELIALQPNADPQAVAAHSRAKQMEGNSGACAWAARADDIAVEIKRLQTAGIPTGDPQRSGRDRPDGSRLDWETARVGDEPNGTFYPFPIGDFTPRRDRAFRKGKRSPESLDHGESSFNGAAIS